MHKTGGWLADYRLHQAAEMKSVGELEYWATSMLDRLQDEMNKEQSESRHSVVAHIQQFVQEHTIGRRSLQGHRRK